MPSIGTACSVHWTSCGGDITTRRSFLGGALAAALDRAGAAFAQQPKVWRVGFLAVRSRSTSFNPDAAYDAFVQGLNQAGYVDGRNMVLDWRFAEGDYERLSALAAELVKLHPDVLVTHSTPAALALKRATTTIPIVVVSMSDPVKSGLVTSLAHPGGNITGMANMTADVTPKHFELLKILLPTLSRVGVLLNRDNPTVRTNMKNAAAQADRLGLRVIFAETRPHEDVEKAFARLAGQKAQAVAIAPDALFGQKRSQIAILAAKYRLPSIAAFREDAVAGVLLSYGQSLSAIFRAGAGYVDKILKGAKPGDLPIEQAGTVELVINAATAKTLGVAIPQELRLRATAVIE